MPVGVLDFVVFAEALKVCVMDAEADDEILVVKECTAVAEPVEVSELVAVDDGLPVAETDLKSDRGA